MPLTEGRRTQLDDIVSRMEAAGETPESIKFVVADFQKLHGQQAALPEPPAPAEPGMLDTAYNVLRAGAGVAGGLVDTVAHGFRRASDRAIGSVLAQPGDIPRGGAGGPEDLAEREKFNEQLGLRPASPAERLVSGATTAGQEFAPYVIPDDWWRDKEGTLAQLAAGGQAGLEFATDLATDASTYGVWGALAKAKVAGPALRSAVDAYFAIKMGQGAAGEFEEAQRLYAEKGKWTPEVTNAFVKTVLGGATAYLGTKGTVKEAKVGFDKAKTALNKFREPASALPDAPASREWTEQDAQDIIDRKKYVDTLEKAQAQEVLDAQKEQKRSALKDNRSKKAAERAAIAAAKEQIRLADKLEDAAAREEITLRAEAELSARRAEVRRLKDEEALIRAQGKESFQSKKDAEATALAEETALGKQQQQILDAQAAEELRAAKLKGNQGMPPQPAAEETAKVRLADDVTRQQEAPQVKAGLDAFRADAEAKLGLEPGQSAGMTLDALVEALERQERPAAPAEGGLTPEGSGTSLISNEELSRASSGQVYYKVDKGGNITFQGPQPDPVKALRPGEAVVLAQAGKEPIVVNSNALPDSVALEAFGRSEVGRAKPALPEAPAGPEAQLDAEVAQALASLEENSGQGRAKPVDRLGQETEGLPVGGRAAQGGGEPRQQGEQLPSAPIARDAGPQAPREEVLQGRVPGGTAGGAKSKVEEAIASLPPEAQAQLAELFKAGPLKAKIGEALPEAPAPKPPVELDPLVNNANARSQQVQVNTIGGYKLRPHMAEATRGAIEALKAEPRAEGAQPSRQEILLALQKQGLRMGSAAATRIHLAADALEAELGIKREAPAAKAPAEPAEAIAQKLPDPTKLDDTQKAQALNTAIDEALATPKASPRGIPEIAAEAKAAYEAKDHAKVKALSEEIRRAREAAEPPIAELEKAFEEAKAKTEALGAEPPKPSPRLGKLIQNNAPNLNPAHVEQWHAERKAHDAWSRKHSALIKVQIAAGNRMHAAKIKERQFGPEAGVLRLGRPSAEELARGLKRKKEGGRIGDAAWAYNMANMVGKTSTFLANLHNTGVKVGVGTLVDLVMAADPTHRASMSERLRAPEQLAGDFMDTLRLAFSAEPGKTPLSPGGEQLRKLEGFGMEHMPSSAIRTWTQFSSDASEIAKQTKKEMVWHAINLGNILGDRVATAAQVRISMAPLMAELGIKAGDYGALLLRAGRDKGLTQRVAGALAQAHNDAQALTYRRGATRFSRDKNTAAALVDAFNGLSGFGKFVASAATDQPFVNAFLANAFTDFVEAAPVLNLLSKRVRRSKEYYALEDRAAKGQILTPEERNNLTEFRQNGIPSKADIRRRAAVGPTILALGTLYFLNQDDEPRTKPGDIPSSKADAKGNVNVKSVRSSFGSFYSYFALSEVIARKIKGDKIAADKGKALPGWGEVIKSVLQQRGGGARLQELAKIISRESPESSKITAVLNKITADLGAGFVPHFVQGLGTNAEQKAPELPQRGDILGVSAFKRGVQSKLPKEKDQVVGRFDPYTGEIEKSGGFMPTKKAPFAQLEQRVSKLERFIKSHASQLPSSGLLPRQTGEASYDARLFGYWRGTLESAEIDTSKGTFTLSELIDTPKLTDNEKSKALAKEMPKWVREASNAAKRAVIDREAKAPMGLLESEAQEAETEKVLEGIGMGQRGLPAPPEGRGLKRWEDRLLEEEIAKQQ